jgi:hypothetical protein
MTRPKINKRKAEHGTSHLAETVKRLEKRISLLESKLNWPEIIPMDEEARAIFKQGQADIKAGRMTPAFSSVEEMKEYFKAKHR